MFGPIVGYIRRRAALGQIMEGYSQENPLGLPRDNQGHMHQLRVEVIARTNQEGRLNACATLCNVLSTLPNGATAFKNLTQP